MLSFFVDAGNSAEQMGFQFRSCSFGMENGGSTPHRMGKRNFVAYVKWGQRKRRLYACGIPERASQYDRYVGSKLVRMLLNQNGFDHDLGARGCVAEHDMKTVDNDC